MILYLLFNRTNLFRAPNDGNNFTVNLNKDDRRLRKKPFAHRLYRVYSRISAR